MIPSPAVSAAKQQKLDPTICIWPEGPICLWQIYRWWDEELQERASKKHALALQVMG